MSASFQSRMTPKNWSHYVVRITAVNSISSTWWWWGGLTRHTQSYINSQHRHPDQPHTTSLVPLGVTRGKWRLEPVLVMASATGWRCTKWAGTEYSDRSSRFSFGRIFLLWWFCRTQSSVFMLNWWPQPKNSSILWESPQVNMLVVTIFFFPVVCWTLIRVRITLRILSWL